MLADHHKRYLIITGAVIALAILIFVNKIEFKRNVNEEIKVNKYDKKTNSLMLLADDKIKRIKEIQEYKNKDQHELDMLINRSIDIKDGNKDLLNQIAKLKDKMKSYDTQLITLNDVRPSPMIIQPMSLLKDTVIYNVIRKDTVIYNIIRKDTVVYLTDTVYVEPRYIKNKFYKQ